MEYNWRYTRGAQRARLKFSVFSENGIKEVLVQDADRGPLRRFAGNGAHVLSREFELVHDKQHALTLEVVDNAGKRAFSREIFVYSYKRGWFRCADNLNILGSTGLLLHPDRLMMLEMCPPLRNGEFFTINGYDRGAPMCPMPGVQSLEQISTAEFGANYPDPNRVIKGAGSVHLNKVLEMNLNSYGLIGATMHMTALASQGDIGAAKGNIARDIAPLDFFERRHTMIAPEDRADYYIVWNSRRLQEG